ASVRRRLAFLRSYSGRAEAGSAHGFRYVGMVPVIVMPQPLRTISMNSSCLIAAWIAWRTFFSVNGGLFGRWSSYGRVRRWIGNMVVISAMVTFAFDALIDATSANSRYEMSVCWPRNAAVAAVGSITYWSRTSST